MKFAVFAALFAAANAAVDVSLPFSMDELAQQMALPGKTRYDKYVTDIIAKWKAEDTKAGTIRSATYYTTASAAATKWASDIATAAGLTGTALTKLYEDLWLERIKLDVQFRESEKMVATVASELIAANPALKTKLATAADVTAFTTAVQDMGDKLVVATLDRAEQATVDKASAGIFALDAAAQAEYDKTQAALKKAQEDKAKANAEAALKALEAAVKAGTYVAPTGSVTEFIASMKAANDDIVAEQALAADATKAQMAELKKLGLFKAGADALTAEEKKALVDKQKLLSEAASAAANPVPGKAGYPCPRYEDGVDEDGDKKYARFNCAEGFCCGTAWTADVDEDDTLIEQDDGTYKSFHVKNDSKKQRLEVCGKATVIPEGETEAVPNNKFTHTIIVSDIPTQIELEFACITGAKALAASAAAVLGLYTAM